MTALRLTAVFLCLVGLTAATMHPLALSAALAAGAAAALALTVSALRYLRR